MAIKIFNQKRIMLGVTGSIAAYKAADLASKLTQAGAQVETILTENATRFIAPLTFQSVTGRKSYVEADLWGSQGHVTHVGLSRQTQLLLIAPASAQTIAKLARGIADNLLSLTALAYSTGDPNRPFLVAPAMDANMYANPATQENVEILQKRGVVFIGPEYGHLASGLVARGRMSEPADIFDVVRYQLSRSGPLKGRKIVVTAGGTQEPIDPVRTITNRSSGKQGFALAQAALDMGADVTLIAASTHLPVPGGVTLVQVVTAEEMRDAVLTHCDQADALLMAAAVSDFRPVQVAAQKIKKSDGLPAIALESTDDILALVGEKRLNSGFPLRVVGFAAETEDLLANARLKLHSKRLDMIAANNITEPGSGFAVDSNRVTLLMSDGYVEPLPVLSKVEVAEKVIEHLIDLLKTTDK